MSSVNLHIANALRLAHSDLEAAEMLAEIGNRYDAFHAQQTAEKILLALLTAEGIRAERKDAHRLDVLRDLLPDANRFKSRFADLVYLTAFATTYRYPKDAGRLPTGPDPRDLKEAIGALSQLLEEVSSHFGVRLTDSELIAARTSAAPR